MPPAALLARSVLLRSVRPGPAPRGVSKGPQQSALSPVVSGAGGLAGGPGRGGHGGDLGTGRAGPGRERRGLTALPPQESFVGFAAMFAACLGPAAWVLAHLNDYKKRE
ncbi:hypothetical protein WISP_00313 [Willisornis vidua]|uniref:COX8A oxidase n=1 Tax=Willisornis vidua TaxID=1566151 RepID=A0ABQ9E1E4_9PASS|nr:hypothetical protein WISP_00313 [Willisornis vidua]